MIDMPFVSVVMATYNGKRFLQKQLESLFAQTYKDIEIIVCDDNSSDDSYQILLENQTSNMKVLRNIENAGFVKTFERVISQAKGDHIALCDQDDIWLPEKIETLVKEIGNNILIHSDAYLIDANDNIISDTSTFKVKKFLQNKTFTDYLRTNSATGCTVMFKKELLQTVLPFPKNTQYHDWWLVICASKIGKIRYLNKPLLKYRIHSNNASSTFYKNKAAFIKQSRAFYAEVYTRFESLLNFKEKITLRLYSCYFFIFTRILVKLGLLVPKKPE